MRARLQRLLTLAFVASGVGAAAVLGCGSFSSDAGPVGEDAAIEAAPPGADAAPADDAGCIDVVERFTDDKLAQWQVAGVGGQVGVTSMLPDAVAPPSLPSAFFAHGTLPDGGGNLTAFITRAIDFMPTSLLASYGLYMPQSTNYGQVGCALRFVGDGTQTATVDVTNSHGNLGTRYVVLDGGGGANHDLVAQPITGFITIDIAVAANLDAGTFVATVSAHTLDGTPLAKVLLEPTALPPRPSAVKLECGITYADFGGPATTGPDRIEVLMDDIKIRACAR